MFLVSYISIKIGISRSLKLWSIFCFYMDPC